MAGHCSLRNIALPAEPVGNFQQGGEPDSQLLPVQSQLRAAKSGAVNVALPPVHRHHLHRGLLQAHHYFLQADSQQQLQHLPRAHATGHPAHLQPLFRQGEQDQPTACLLQALPQPHLRRHPQELRFPQGQNHLLLLHTRT